MLLRTISVETAEQTELNAALLCGFAIPASDRNFIAYSLNEQVDENDSRVYIASLFKTDDSFRLGRLDTDEACEAAIQVFRQLVREATTGNRRTSDLAYHLIDLQDAAIAPSRREEHRSLVLEREWLMKLVTFESPMATAPPWMARNPARKSRRSSRRPFSKTPLPMSSPKTMRTRPRTGRRSPSTSPRRRKTKPSPRPDASSPSRGRRRKRQRPRVGRQPSSRRKRSSPPR